MENPLKVSLENIIPLTEARDHFSQIVNEVQKDKLYVLTKGGKPAVAIIDVKYLEHITGGEAKVENIKEEIKKAPEKVGLPPMIEHAKTPPNPIPPTPSTPPPFVPKPAGFAAPQPKPEPPKPPIQNPNPVTFTPTTPKPTPPPPSSNPVPPVSPSVSPNQGELKTPSPTPPPPNNPTPLKTPDTAGEKIDVQFSQEPVEEKIKSANSFQAPDDKTPPGQYGGKQDEPEDMSID